MNKFKRLYIGVLLASLMVASVCSIFALHTPAGLDGAVSETYPYTSIVYTWTVLDSLNQANADSLLLIVPADSTEIATMDSVSQTTYTRTGLVPNTQYITAVAADSSAEVYGISNSDTTSTTALVFALTASATNPKTTVDWTITDMLDSTGVDSICIVNTADSSIMAYFPTDRTTSGSLTGLSPNTTYMLGFANRTGGAAHYLANLDTITTSTIDVEPSSHGTFRDVGDILTHKGEPMRTATSHNVYNASASLDTTTFNLYAEAGLDSSMHYIPWTTNDVMFVCDDDSAAYTVLAYSGSYKSGLGYHFELKDSLNVTATGTHVKSFTLPMTEFFYLVFRGDADCGYIDIKAYLNRDRH